MPEIELFTANICPYAHRVHLALLEKGLEFWHTEIDLKDKPEWFLVISPLGEVPVIRHEDRFVANSTVTLEYLEDVHPEPALRPKDSAKRAIASFWIEFANERLAPAIDRCLAAESQEEQEVNAAYLRDLLLFIEREGLARCGRGPYWLGSDLTMVDLAFYPFFERLPAIQQHRPVTLPLISIRLRYWLDAMRQRASVKAAQNPTEFYAAHYASGREGNRESDPENIEYLHA